MSLSSVVHASSTFESGAPLSYCVALFANSPFSTFFGAPWMSLPSAVHVSSTFEFGAMLHDCLSVDPQVHPQNPMLFSFHMDLVLYKTLLHKLGMVFSKEMQHSLEGLTSHTTTLLVVELPNHMHISSQPHPNVFCFLYICRCHLCPLGFYLVQSFLVCEYSNDSGQNCFICDL